MDSTLVTQLVTTLRVGSLPLSPFAALDEAARSVPCSGACFGRSASSSAVCAPCDACARCSMMHLRPRELTRLRISKQKSRSLLRCGADGNASDGKVAPVRFVHFPKCGTSFTYTLVAHRCAHVISVDDLHAQLKIDEGGF